MTEAVCHMCGRPITDVPCSMNSDGAAHVGHPHNLPFLKGPVIMDGMNHDYMVREPGPGDVSYRGMGVWAVIPIPRSWRTALEIAVASAPGLGDHQDIKLLLAAPVVETDGTVTNDRSL